MYVSRTQPFPLRCFRSTLSVEFPRYCTLSGGAERHTLPCYQSEEILHFIKIFISPHKNRTDYRRDCIHTL